MHDNLLLETLFSWSYVNIVSTATKSLLRFPRVLVFCLHCKNKARKTLDE